MVDVVSRLGFGCPTSSAFRQETQRSKASAEQQRRWRSVSSAVFVDNHQHQRKRTSRARADKRLRVQSRIVQIVFSLPASHNLARVQFDSPLRQSPLPVLQSEVFECQESDRAALDAFAEREMLKITARFLLSLVDPVDRLLKIRDALHEDSIAAKTCTNSACSGYLGPLYGSLKRKCDVSVAAFRS